MEFKNTGNEITAPLENFNFLDNRNSLDLETAIMSTLKGYCQQRGISTTHVKKNCCVVEWLGYGKQFNSVQTGFKI